MESRDLVLAALDMDGTLLNSAHAVTPCARAVIDRAAQAGKIVALCTGRCLSELREHLEALPGVGYVIGENGGCLYDVRAGRVLRQLSLPDDIAGRLLDASEGMDVCRQGFLNGRSYMELTDTARLDRWHIGDFAPVFEAGSTFVPDLRACWRRLGVGLEKLNLYFATAAERDRFRAAIPEGEVLVAGSLGLGWELSPPGASKGLGLMALCGLLGVPLERTMAVGDGGNDLDLMSAAGFSVAMGNAIGEVRTMADALTEDCDHDGAARAVARYLLGEAL